jgi:hypothetical protein
MINLSKILKEVIAESVAKTDLGQDIHMIVESRDDIYSFKYTLLVHIIKMVMTSNPNSRDKKLWAKTLTKSVGNIVKDRWFKEKQVKAKQKELDLDNVASMFIDAYRDAKEEWEDSEQEINRIPFPKEATQDQKTKIFFYYNRILGSVLRGDGRDFLNNPENYI